MERHGICMRKVALGLYVILCTFILAGCRGKQAGTEPGVEVLKNGTVTWVLEEAFDKDFYDMNELEDMIRLEIAEYNQEKGDERIELESLEMAENNCRAILVFDSYKDYAEYSDTNFFVGTVEEALEEGINLNLVMVENNQENTIGPGQIRQMTDYHLVMWYGDMAVRVPGKIRYHGENMTLLGSKEIIAEPDLTGPFYLLYK